MRHYKKGRRLGTDSSHTKAMKRSLVAALLENDRIKTTELRAKEIRPDVDKVITWAKRGDLHSRRLAIAKVGDKELVRELFEKVEQGMFKDRPGGYTRIMKLGTRKGDNAKIVIMELVTEPVQPKGEKDSGKKAESKPASKPAKADKEEEAAEDKAENAAEATEEKAAETAEPAAEAEEAAEPAAEAAETAEPAAEAEDEAAEPATEAEAAEPAADAAEPAAEDKAAEPDSKEEPASE